MNIKSGSLSDKILRTLKLSLEEGGYAIYEFGKIAGILMSKKTMGQTIAAMSGYKHGEDYDAGFENSYNTAIYRLKKRGFIKFTDKDQFSITDKGNGIILEFDIENIQLNNFDPKNWDGIWRVLIFDIPEITRANRNIFREKIQDLGFYTLQKSVYVLPQPCEKEIFKLAGLLRIKEGINIIKADNLGHAEKAVKKFFKLV